VSLSPLRFAVSLISDRERFLPSAIFSGAIKRGRIHGVFQDVSAGPASRDWRTERGSSECMRSMRMAMSVKFCENAAGSFDAVLRKGASIPDYGGWKVCRQFNVCRVRHWLRLRLGTMFVSSRIRRKPRRDRSWFVTEEYGRLFGMRFHLVREGTCRWN